MRENLLGRARGAQQEALGERAAEGEHRLTCDGSSIPSATTCMSSTAPSSTIISVSARVRRRRASAMKDRSIFRRSTGKLRSEFSDE